MNERELENGGDGGPLAPVAIRRLAWVLLAALVVIALSLLWSAGEAHYRGCVEAVKVRSAGDDTALARLARTEGLERCGRLPF
ncbi:MAG: hypothetical protein ACRDM7_04045 [Thermoleophilaceae bacterium]